MVSERDWNNPYGENVITGRRRRLLEPSRRANITIILNEVDAFEPGLGMGCDVQLHVTQLFEALTNTLI
jgi:hypothetical protein